MSKNRALFFYRRRIAKLLDVNPYTIDRWHKQGRLKLRTNPENGRKGVLKEDLQDLNTYYHIYGYWDFKEADQRRLIKEGYNTVKENK